MIEKEVERDKDTDSRGDTHWQRKMCRDTERGRKTKGV